MFIHSFSLIYHKIQSDSNQFLLTFSNVNFYSQHFLCSKSKFCHAFIYITFAMIMLPPSETIDKTTPLCYDDI